MSSQEKSNFLINNESNFIYSLREEHTKIIKMINKIRIENDIEELKNKKSEKLQDYFLIVKNEIFFINNNIIKLDNKKYLLIYPIGEFKNKLINNDKDIIKILLFPHLTDIIILEQEKNEYILIYEKEYIPKNNIHILSIRNNENNESK